MIFEGECAPFDFFHSFIRVGRTTDGHMILEKRTTSTFAMPELKWLQGFEKEGASSKDLPLGILRNLTLKLPIFFFVKTFLKFVSPHS